MAKVLVCGSRGNFKDYRELVFGVLGGQSNIEIIEGCCPNSADQYAEEFAIKQGQFYPIKITHFPSNSGNYLKRNIEMVNACDEVIAFWDGWSYGTAHTVACAVARKKPVWIIDLEKEDNHIKLEKFIK